MAKINFSDAFKKYAQITFFLVVSGFLGYISAQIANNEALTLIFAPAINFVLYGIKVEVLDKAGVVQALKK